MASNPTITDPTIRASLARALQLMRRLWRPGEKDRQRLADWWRREYRYQSRKAAPMACSTGSRRE